MLRLAILCVILPIIVACSASSRFNLAARGQDLVREEITLNELPLVIYRDKELSRSSTVHMYFDGDGSPWVDGVRIASDPTSRSKLILDLMAADKAFKILIGRPCYYIEVNKRPAVCKDALWTSHRYSNAVVSAMREVVKRQIARYQATEVVLIGYSGGGTLAMLVAATLNELDTLITVAANLNVDAWVNLHGYTPLAPSLNEHNFPQLPKHIRQIHFVGGQDENVPPSITRSIAVSQHNARVVERQEYTHSCCWPKTWANILRETLN